MPASFSGFLFIADITGYTLYLTQSELDHAQGILADLLSLLVDHTRPPLILSRLAGDAVISYALEDHFVQGQTFIEMIEDTYTSFRKALERMVLNNTCRCNACTNISNLDLKFFAHYGEFAIQRIHDHDELVGNDVNLLHRLLKNHVAEITGFKAYTLYTQPLIQQLGIEEICAKMIPHAETYEYLGDIQVWIQDMHPVWELKRHQSRATLPPEQVLLKWTIDIHLPPARVWDYLSQPEYRKIVVGTHGMDVQHRDGGRITSGSVYHCYHGKQVVPQLVLEWQPFERILTKDRPPVPIQEIYIYSEYLLEAISDGTRLTMMLSKASGPLPGRWLVDKTMLKYEAKGHEDMKAFKQLVEQTDQASYQPTIAPTPFTAASIQDEVLSSLVENPRINDS